jgi:phosphoenolpyruvate carboxykinase (ATP)
MSTGAQLSEVDQLLEGGKVRRNLKPKDLTEAALARKEAMLASNGALTAETGKRTGRSPKDRFIVKDSTTANVVDWGTVNQSIDSAKFDALLTRSVAYLKDKEIYVQDLFSGADPKYRLPVRFINEYAWHNLFVRQLFVRPSEAELSGFAPDFTVICVPGLHADPQRDGTNSEAFILLDFTRKIVLVGGTRYAGELKKSIFGVMNFLLPARDVFPMHCSANVGAAGDTALFFGLSGTGKTTLSADPSRRLIGDDEHGWSPTGIFNFEGGCYAKCIKLSKTNEPQIWNALRSGAVLENVVLDPETRKPDYDDDRLTENTRAAYPVEFIENAVIPGIGGHPKQIVFLTADAFGVLPPISKLSPEQAMYHFLSGYTAKVAGTEAGVGKEPQATFSTCFGAPFMPRPPKVYAEMLGNRMRQHGALCWLVNTGWYGGPYGTGQRMSLPYTRMMVRSLVDGQLNNAEFVREDAFGLMIPKHIDGIPERLLNPRNAWADKLAYDKKAADLAERFTKNFAKFDAPAEVRAAGPQATKK